MYKAIGLMTGTSFDCIDLAYLQSDGINQINLLKNFNKSGNLLRLRW